MERIDVAKQRMHNQRLTGVPFDRPEEVVRWLGAVQSQDYGGAKWGVAQRTTGATNAELDRLFAEGAILRTHVLRPTWHFVAPDDIRWLLGLTGPRVHAANAFRYRQLELDDVTLRRGNDLLANALQGGKSLTRAELAEAIQGGGIDTSGQRLAHMVMYAELDAVICSGHLRGKQFTYALFDERVPRTREFTRDEALAELTRRYFASHGPATVQDFAWWSGLTVTDGKTGIELAKAHLTSEVVDGRTYWLAAAPMAVQPRTPAVHLIPNYDEYLVAYRDRSAALDESVIGKIMSDRDAIFADSIIIDGLVAGRWRRTVGRYEVTVRTSPFVPLSGAERDAVRAAADVYGRFLELPVRFEDVMG